MKKEGDPVWLKELQEDELLDIVSNPERNMESLTPDIKFGLLSTGHIFHKIDSSEMIDKIGNKFLPEAIDGPVSYAFWPDYWERLKDELKIFICTTDKKYADLRKKLTASAEKSQIAIVSTIAAAMAAQFGVLAGVLVPFVAMCLIVLARTGKEAFCSTLKWNTPLNPKAESEHEKG